MLNYRYFVTFCIINKPNTLKFSRHVRLYSRILLLLARFFITYYRLLRQEPSEFLSSMYGIELTTVTHSTQN